MDYVIHRDCRYYNGYKPCTFHKKEGVECEGCPHYDKIGKKVLVINLEALGDVIRTTMILPIIKKRFPDSHVTWLTTQKAVDALKYIDSIDRIMVYNHDSVLRLQVEKFDFLVNLEKDYGPCALASIIKAKEKKGLGLGEDGHFICFNEGANELLITGISDRLKWESKKTQQEAICDIMEVPYTYQRSLFPLLESHVAFAENFWGTYNLHKELVIGLNTGCSNRIFIDRKWTKEGFIELANLLSHKLNAKILLFGGKNEMKLNAEIKRRVDVPVIDTGTDNSLHEFGALINKCDAVVTADTMAVHLAAALGTNVVVLFGMVSPHQIEIYGNGSKLLAPKPCECKYNYKCKYEKSCMHSITPQMVFDEIIKVLNK